MDSILFIIAAIAAVGCGLNLVLQKHPISSALSLIGVMSSLALLYLLLGAEFIAMAQMIVYGGAVMVLFIFVIMLLNAGSEKLPASRCWPCWLYLCRSSSAKHFLRPSRK
jgi:NADH-quinone oxidoreductase subunit J